MWHYLILGGGIKVKLKKKCVAKFLPRIRVVRVNSDIEKLLNLQTKDAALSAIKGRLDAVPQEIESKRAEIRAVEKNCDAAREKLRATQARRDEMRSQRRALEEKIFKYKNQLLEVKKNDDYTAINAEIERLSAKASEMEEEELLVMFEIDSMRDGIAELEKQAKGRITAIEEEISLIEAAKAGIERDFNAARDCVLQAREQVGAAFLAAYDKLKASKTPFPIVAKVENSLCTGCFLKVSGEQLDALKSAKGPVFCEQCGRIIFL